ncbi:hypothetical protein LB505_004766 [Fusarium chuoi]|nr:hypothetical protein LB505_004766 [Fusarium chuoi]
MSHTESSASEAAVVESAIDVRSAVGSIFTASFPSDDSDTESTLVTRRRPSSHTSMDDDTKNDASPRRNTHSKTMTDSASCHPAAHPLNQSPRPQSIQSQPPLSRVRRPRAPLRQKPRTFQQMIATLGALPLVSL